MPDRFNGLVYHIADADVFLTVVDRKAKRGDHVVTERRGGELTIELYRGQSHYGVVNLLRFYLLPSGSLQHKTEDQRPKREKPKKPRTYWPRQLAC